MSSWAQLRDPLEKPSTCSLFGLHIQVSHPFLSPSVAQTMDSMADGGVRREHLHPGTLNSFCLELRAGGNPGERSQLFRTSVTVVAQGPFSGKLRLTGKKTVPESVLAAFAKTAEHSLGSSFSPQLSVLGRLRKFLPVLFSSAVKD